MLTNLVGYFNTGYDAGVVVDEELEKKTTSQLINIFLKSLKDTRCTTSTQILISYDYQYLFYMLNIN